MSQEGKVIRAIARKVRYSGVRSWVEDEVVATCTLDEFYLPREAGIKMSEAWLRSKFSEGYNLGIIEDGKDRRLVEAGPNLPLDEESRL